jgi:hypothetical protein
MSPQEPPRPPPLPPELEATFAGKPPPIQLDPIGHILCARHGEPYRANWPMGIGAMLAMGLEFIKEDIELAQEWEALGGVEYMGAALTKRPICERVSPEHLMMMYLDSKIGVFGLCDHCRDIKCGTPYRLMNYWGRLVKKRHLCFDCVLYRMERRST